MRLLVFLSMLLSFFLLLLFLHTMAVLLYFYLPGGCIERKVEGCLPGCVGGSFLYN